MKTTKYLPKLEATALYTSNRYRNVLSRIDESNFEDINVKMCYLSIGLCNLVSNFNKAFFLSCGRNPKGRDKKHSLSLHRFTTDDKLLEIIIKKYKPSAAPKANGSWSKKDEPSRYEIQHVEYGLLTIGSRKINDLYIVQGMNLSIHTNLPTFRNFYAHKNLKTQSSVREILPSLAIPDLHPSLALLQPPNGRSVSLMMNWLDDFDVMIPILCS